MTGGDHRLVAAGGGTGTGCDGPKAELGSAAAVRRRSSEGDEGTAAYFSVGPSEGQSRPDRAAAG
jgi:hypothetical protein